MTVLTREKGWFKVASAKAISGDKIVEDILKYWAVLGPILGGVVMWLLNQRSKWKWEKHIRKEERYVGFLDSLTGFYVGSESGEKKTEFIRQWRLAWLYCPDEVIRLGNDFLDTVKVKKEKSTDEEKETALANLVLELRRDMVGKVKTCLNIADYKVWRSLD